MSPFSISSFLSLISINLWDPTSATLHSVLALSQVFLVPLPSISMLTKEITLVELCQNGFPAVVIFDDDRGEFL